MVVIAEAKFPSTQMLRNAIQALREVSNDIRFDFTDGSVVDGMDVEEVGPAGIRARLSSTDAQFFVEYFCPADSLVGFEVAEGRESLVGFEVAEGRVVLCACGERKI